VSRIAVLGCGPAGLLAAHAVKMTTGSDPIIVSNDRISPLYGAQYLHKPIPGTESWATRGRLVRYELRGTSAEYRSKVYGNKAEDERVSPEDLIGEHYAWDIRSTYLDLYRRYKPVIISHLIDRNDLLGTSRLLQGMDVVISSVHRHFLCEDRDGHQFRSQRVWARGDAPELDRWAGIDVPDDRVICDGSEDVAWYRAARVFHHTTVEWPTTVARPDGASSVDKPIGHNCDCNPLGVSLFVGRYGSWRKGILSHEAYYDTVQALS